MCIIAAKAKGVKMPDRNTIRTMWYGNPDGAGLMYAKDGKVVINKGFMKLSSFEKFLDKLEKEIDTTETAIVMHFRITTHGGTKPENTHPFPITDSIKRLQLTRCTAPLGVAHNGVIDITPRSREISDTMEYIASQLAPLSKALPEFYRNDDAMQLIQNAIRSRMVFLTGDGELFRTGSFVEDEGVWYSNTSYLGRFRYGNVYDWDKSSYWDSLYATAKPKNTGKSSGKSKDKKSKDKAKAKATKPAEPMSAALMWVGMASEGAYVVTGDGNIMEGDDFLIDADCNVYLYDWNMDACSPLEKATAFTGSGLPMRFNADDASEELVLPF